MPRSTSVEMHFVCSMTDTMAVVMCVVGTLATDIDWLAGRIHSGGCNDCGAAGGLCWRSSLKSGHPPPRQTVPYEEVDTSTAKVNTPLMGVELLQHAWGGGGGLGRYQEDEIVICGSRTVTRLVVAL